ncbi:MAG: hypothetical protein ACFFCZ_12560 [Promethearchaeota archaeon]
MSDENSRPLDDNEDTAEGEWNLVKKYEEAEAKNRLIEFLQGKQIEYKIENEGTPNEYCWIPFEIALDEKESKFFQIVMKFNGKWLELSSKIVDGEDIKVKKDGPDQCRLFRRLLWAVNELPEVNYEVDAQDSIYVSVDMNWQVTDYSNFYSDLFAIPNGIKHFIEHVAPEFGIEVKGVPELKELES